MRRLFIIRKDLNLSPGKLSAMLMHCAEAYWTNMMKSSKVTDNEFSTLPSENAHYPGQPAVYMREDYTVMAKDAFERGEKSFIVRRDFPKETVTVEMEIPKDVWNGYVNDIFTKTVCECRNLNQLRKAEDLAKALGLEEGNDYGFIDDCCKTELTPENEDGTCTVGMWFKPLPDETAHEISKKFKLYRD